MLSPPPCFYLYHYAVGPIFSPRCLLFFHGSKKCVDLRVMSRNVSLTLSFFPLVNGAANVTSCVGERMSERSHAHAAQGGSQLPAAQLSWATHPTLTLLVFDASHDLVVFEETFLGHRERPKLQNFPADGVQGQGGVQGLQAGSIRQCLPYQSLCVFLYEKHHVGQLLMGVSAPSLLIVEALLVSRKDKDFSSSLKSSFVYYHIL